MWNDSAFSDYPAAPGLWAVEPHIGGDGVGVKFEELLVVTDDDAFWLDDQLPHSLRWADAGLQHRIGAAAVTPSRTQAARRCSSERRAATEQAILDATQALLEERSFHDVNVEDIMARAGLGRTAFYRYFPDLESVVSRLMGTLVEELRGASQTWLAADEPQTSCATRSCTSPPSTATTAA